MIRYIRKKPIGMIIDTLPGKFVRRMSSQLGSEARLFFDALEEPYVRGLRIRRGILPDGTDPLDTIPWAKDGYYIPADSRAGSMVLHEAGAFYLQEPSAMIPVSVLDPQPGERILDLCAAPGGKSTQIGALMHGKGLLVCNEPVWSRAKVLSMNIERMGIGNAIVTSAMPRELETVWEDSFDKILVDAPCSGEGMFRRHPEAAAEWYEGINEACAERQSVILRSAAKMLRSGGTLVYSTCTFSPLENEETIRRFLTGNNDFRLEPFSVNGLAPCDGMMTYYPHRIRGEGHFAAKLIKSGSAAAGRHYAPPHSKQDAAVNFLKQFGFEFPAEKIGTFSGRYVLLPEDPVPVTGIKVLRLSLDLCEAKGTVFAPLHALALWQDRVDVELGLEEAVRFIHGESIQKKIPIRGYVIAGYKGCPLGWGKASDGIIKNHYPKGLRKQLQI